MGNWINPIDSMLLLSETIKFSLRALQILSAINKATMTRAIIIIKIVVELGTKIELTSVAEYVVALLAVVEFVVMVVARLIDR